LQQITEKREKSTTTPPLPPPQGVPVRRSTRDIKPPTYLSDDQAIEANKTKIIKTMTKLASKKEALKRKKEAVKHEIKKKITVSKSKRITATYNDRIPGKKNEIDVLPAINEYIEGNYNNTIIKDLKLMLAETKKHSSDEDSIISFRKETREKLNIFPEILEKGGFKYDINEIAKLSTKQELGKYLEQISRFDMNSIDDKNEKKRMQKLLNDILYESIKIDSKELQPEEKDKLERLLIEKINTDFFMIENSEIRGASFPVGEADQFKDTWGVKLFDSITDNRDHKTNPFKCYQCQQTFLSRVNDSKVEMEHKIPCITFAERVPYIGHFKTEMIYYKKWLKFNHKLEKEDINKTLLKNLTNEDFLQYMYRFINCVTVKRTNYKKWSIHVNNLLNKWIRNFQVFMFSEIVKNMKSPNKIEYKKKLMSFTHSERVRFMNKTDDELSTISGKSGYQIKHQLFKRSLKACLFEYAYAHQFCNRIKTNCNFLNPGEIDGYLQTCFECVGSDGKVIKTKEASMPKTIYRVPGAIDPQTKFWKRDRDMFVKDYYSNKHLKKYKALEDGFVKTNSIMLNSNEIYGKINGGVKKAGGNYLGEHQFLEKAYSGDIDGPQYQLLSDHLQIVFQLFDKIVENVTDEDYIVDHAKTTSSVVSLGSRPNNKIRVSKDMLFYYNISKMALNHHSKVQKSLLDKIHEKFSGNRDLSTFMIDNLTNIRSGKQLGGKRTRKKRVKINKKKKRTRKR
jgi:hypothetical protein